MRTSGITKVLVDTFTVSRLWWVHKSHFISKRSKVSKKMPKFLIWLDRCHGCCSSCTVSNAVCTTGAVSVSERKEKKAVSNPLKKLPFSNPKDETHSENSSSVKCASISKSENYCFISCSTTRPARSYWDKYTES